MLIPPRAAEKTGEIFFYILEKDNPENTSHSILLVRLNGIGQIPSCLILLFSGTIYFN
jgi:hypothetical protein